MLSIFLTQLSSSESMIDFSAQWPGLAPSVPIAYCDAKNSLKKPLPSLMKGHFQKMAPKGHKNKPSILSPRARGPVCKREHSPRASIWDLHSREEYVNKFGVLQKDRSYQTTAL